MLNSELSIEVSTGINPLVIRVYDTSAYLKDEKVQNLLLEVLPVNRAQWVTFRVGKGFSFILNSSNLLYKKAYKSSELIDLPDGIYEMKLSYNPNAVTVQHFYHLRIVSALRKVYNHKDQLIRKVCKLKESEYANNLDKLRDVEEYLLAAKWRVEECHDKKEGKEMYEWALKLLEQYGNECKCK